MFSLTSFKVVCCTPLLDGLFNLIKSITDTLLKLFVLSNIVIKHFKKI